MRKARIQGLNRKIFKRNLKRILKDDLKWSIEGSALEYWVEDYRKHCTECGGWGWYEVSRAEHKDGRAEEIRTN